MDRETGPKPTATRRAKAAGSQDDDVGTAALVRPLRSDAGGPTADAAISRDADPAAADAASDQLSGDQLHHDQQSGDQQSGDQLHHDQQSGDQQSGDQLDDDQLDDEEADAAEAAAGSWQLQRVGFPSRLIMAQLAADPRVPVWTRRAVGVVALAVGFSFWLGWRYGLTIAAAAAILDTVYQSKTVALIPAAARVAFAQRRTKHRLMLLRPWGYHALHARPIPGTESIIDHLVIGPGGVFAVDSERWDRRLPVRTVASNSAAGPVLYHGPFSQKDRLAHARWEAAQATHLLSRELRRQITVRPVMVIYGPTVPWTIAKLRGVDVFSGRKVVRYFTRRARATGRTAMSWEQVGETVAAAERALPRG